MMNMLTRLITESSLRNVLSASPFSALNWSTEPMCAVTDIPLEFLREHYSYDPDTGRFTRLKAHHKRHIGLVANTPRKDKKREGYSEIYILKRSYAQHRVAFYYVYGWLPDILDHINGDRNDNRIANLRPATHKENSINTKPSKNTSSKFKGVWWDDWRGLGRWLAAIRIDGKKTYLGNFTDEIAAAKAYDKAALEHHGEFAKTNKMLGLYE